MRLSLLIFFCWFVCIRGARVPLYYKDGELVEENENKNVFDVLEEYNEYFYKKITHSPSAAPTRSPDISPSLSFSGTDLYDEVLRETLAGEFDNITSAQNETEEIAAAEAKEEEEEEDLKIEKEIEAIKEKEWQRQISLEKAKYNVIFIFPFALSGAFIYFLVKKYGTSFDPSRFYKFK